MPYGEASWKTITWSRHSPQAGPTLLRILQPSRDTNQVGRTFHSLLSNAGEKQFGSFTGQGLNPSRCQYGVQLNCCLIHASIAARKWQAADSARRCRFRKSQQKRASDLDSNRRMDSQAGRRFYEGAGY